MDASGSGSVGTSGRSSSTDCRTNKKVMTSKRYIYIMYFLEYQLTLSFEARSCDFHTLQRESLQ